MHSALKFEGKRLYELARRGESVERAAAHDRRFIASRACGSGGRRAGVRRALLQGHLHPHAGRGHRGAARHAGLCRGAAPAVGRSVRRPAHVHARSSSTPTAADGELATPLLLPADAAFAGPAAGRARHRGGRGDLLQGQDGRGAAAGAPPGDAAGLRRATAASSGWCEGAAGRPGPAGAAVRRRSSADRAELALSLIPRFCLRLLRPRE